MPSTPPRTSYRPPPSHHPPSGGFALPADIARFSTPLKAPTSSFFASHLYAYDLDEEMGLLVGRRMSGTHAECAPLIAEAQRRLVACPGRRHQPKVTVLLVDGDVAPPDVDARRHHAQAASSTTGLFVVVSSSPIARIAAMSIAAMKDEGGALHAGYSDWGMALEWIDAHRPGIRFRLDVMRTKLFASNARATT